MKIMFKKIALITILALSASWAFAGSGIFGSYIVLNINGAGNTFYDLSSATINPDFGGANLGTFNPGAGNTLVLGGGEVDTFKNGSDNVLSGIINYRIYSGAAPLFTPLNEPFRDQNPAFGTNPGDQRWGQGGANPFLTTNLLAGLTPGTYTFEAFASSGVDTTGGVTENATNFANNAGANYIATFTIVPEPVTTFLVGPALLAGMFFIRRRRA